ncbi:MAG: hypothetical protein M8353_08450 [ANME-2 cluster archaeon]|nr:hypothetical protein [ANME-2 cluster archaeon]
MFKATIITILLFCIAIGNVSAIQDPFLIYGYVTYDNGSIGENISINISVPGQTLVEKTNSMGKYIGVLDSYQDGDTILITAIKGAYTSSSQHVLDKSLGGLMVNITLFDRIPPQPITNIGSTAGNFWISWAWDEPDDSDYSYSMISVDGTWLFNTSDNYYNVTYPPHSIKTISIKTVDLYGNVNNNWVNQTSMIPNNPISLIKVPSAMTISENQTLFIDADVIDADSDAPTFYCNRTDLFLDYDEAKGYGNFTPSYADGGIYFVDIGVSDGYGSISNTTISITVDDVPLSVVANRNSKTGNSELVIEAYNNSAVEFTINTNRIPTIVNWYVNDELRQSSTSFEFNNIWNKTGIYYVNVSAKDDFDIAQNLTWTVNVVEYPFTYSLHNGWNLISLPVIKTYSALSLSSLIGDSVDYISTHNSNGYQTYVSGFGPEDFPILPDQGYFIYLSDTTSFTVSGSIPHTRNVDVNKGWNILGWTSINTSNASAAFVESMNGSVEIVVMKNGSGDYQTFIAGFSGPEDNFDVEPGNGYYVYANSNSTLTYGN